MSEKNKITKQLILDGLDCINCATKIETLSKKVEGVETTTLNFATKMLTIEVFDSEKVDKIINDIKKIVKDLEPDVIVREKTASKTTNVDSLQEHKDTFIKLGLSSILFIVALLLKLPFWGEFALYLLSYLIIGSEVLLKAFKNILRGQVFDENFLMSIATVGAFALKEFPEGVAVMLFYQVGELFQAIAVNNSRKSISALLEIRPDYANKSINGEIEKVSPEDVRIGDIIIVKPGEKVPLDGVIVSGTSFVDTSALTGESVPREVAEGDSVLGGFINKNSVLNIEVVKTFGDSTVSKILDLVQNASNKKASTEKFITKFARYYTPVVVLLAVALAIIPPLLTGASFSVWLNRGLVFLVVSCPCALLISIPLGFFGGIGGASRNGILVKGGNYLEALNNIDTVVFDKTGTLTKGSFKVTQIITVDTFSKEQLLEYGAYAESYSTHPIATSILKAYDKDINKNEITDYGEISGKGIKCKVKDTEIIIGTRNFLAQHRIYFETATTVNTVVYIAINNRYSGYIEISDEIKEDSLQAIASLKQIGIKKVAMFTGDNASIGESIGKKLDLDVVYSELLPDQKVEKLELVEQQKATKGKILFVGDGINDAPVLARADVGVAMGGLGSDAAIEAADVVLMTDEPSKLVTAIKIAKYTRQIIWQNIGFAMGIKAIVLLLGAGGIATMWEAVFADVGVALLAILNSMRVMKINLGGLK